MTTLRKISSSSIVIIVSMLLAACAPATQQSPTDISTSHARSDIQAVASTETPISPTATSTSSPTATSTERPTSTATTTPTPTRARIPSTATPKPALQPLDAKVIYHDGITEGGVGKYTNGTTPWLDLLVRLGDQWYGPERAPDDGINALPLPKGYHWQVSGAFNGLPNGEAWWVGATGDGEADLVSPQGIVILQLSLHVLFSGGGGNSPPPNPFGSPTPEG